MYFLMAPQSRGPFEACATTTLEGLLVTVNREVGRQTYFPSEFLATFIASVRAAFRMDSPVRTQCFFPFETDPTATTLVRSIFAVGSGMVFESLASPVSGMAQVTFPRLILNVRRCMIP